MICPECKSETTDTVSFCTTCGAKTSPHGVQGNLPNTEPQDYLNVFDALRFKHGLRPSQQEVVAIAKKQLEQGDRKLHVVAPPGSGKTIVGLYIWAMLIKKPALVLSPNSAIQAQWAEKTAMFCSDGLLASRVAGTDPRSLSSLTSLTYQSLTLPGAGGRTEEEEAISLWADMLLEKEQADDPNEARVWIDKLRERNPEYFAKRLSTYVKKVRDAKSRGGDALSTLHASSLEHIKRIKKQKPELLILDECHHLLGHWGRILDALREALGNPIILGLTATPPDLKGANESDVERYRRFFGEIDYEVPVPALVREGLLAPYRDLVYFVPPEAKELHYLTQCECSLNSLIEELCSATRIDDGAEDRTGESGAAEPKQELLCEANTAPLEKWIAEVIREFRLPTGSVKNWQAFASRDPSLALAGRQFLHHRSVPFPINVPELSPLEAKVSPESLEVLVPVLDRYVRHGLRLSSSTEDHDLAKKVTSLMRMLGVQITETGAQACASPASRIMGYSQGKMAALVPILSNEMECLKEHIRAIVVCDFEKSSTMKHDVQDVISDEAGGAIAAYRTLLNNVTTNQLDPVLLTGSTVLVDADLADRFLEEANEWLIESKADVELSWRDHGVFRELLGQGMDWAPRVYVQMITTLFQKGVTRCLVGTRGLLGEGWDANKINVLVDLTTVTTSMSVNQLRGRSIRLDPEQPDKVANNWDVICIAGNLRQGMDDYNRFCLRHNNLFGVTDDSAIEKGVGHVHPSFTDLEPENLEENITALNLDMLMRAADREKTRSLWKVGTPYLSTPVKAVEIKFRKTNGGFPPFSQKCTVWKEDSLLEAIASCIISALSENKLIHPGSQVEVNECSGYLRAFLKGAPPEEMAIFSEALSEIMGPLENSRYILPRMVKIRSDTFLSRFAPKWLSPYLQKSSIVNEMWHRVPTILAKNKERVASLQYHWNQTVSPGEAVFVQRNDGEVFLREILTNKGLPPAERIHLKELFY